MAVINVTTEKSGGSVKKIAGIILLLLLAALVGWSLAKSSNNNQQADTTNSIQPATTEPASTVDVKSLVSFSLPDGWKETTCPNAEGSVFVVPNGASEVDCNATPSAPVKLSVDSANITDCNQLQGVQNVSKHVCISEFISGKKSIKSETRYNEQSSFKRDTTVHAYYIDTGKGIVKVEYNYTADNAYQMGWEELAKSVTARS